MQNITAKFDGKAVPVVPMESKQKPARSIRPLGIMAIAVALASAFVAQVRADISLSLPNLTPIGTMLGQLIAVGTSLAAPSQAFIEAWFGPAIEGIILIAVIVLILVVVVEGPAKVIEMVEKVFSRIAK